MIENIWEKISIYCGCHDKPIKMVPHEGSTYAVWSGGTNSMFYSCPKYYEENRTPDEHACFNRLNLVEYEEAVTHISDIKEQSMTEDSSVNLTGYRWKNKKGTEFQIMTDDKDGIKISVINRKVKL
jgi:hypothetical protein